MVRQKTLEYIFLIFSLLFYCSISKAQVQNNQNSEQRQRGIQYVRPDETKKEQFKLFEGMAISFDLVGAVMYKLANYGQLEGQLRINLKEKYFPVFELGLGHSNHKDEETNFRFKTDSPYFRIGCDINFNKDKSLRNRIYGGMRYGFTSCKFDLYGDNQIDPVWGTVVPFDYNNLKSSISWLELVFGLEAQIYKTFHLGWSARYKMRVSQTKSDIGNAWYVPGFGKNDTHNFGATFNIIFDI